MGSFGQFYFQLTPKQLEAQRFIISTVATDALVIKHLVISIHGATRIVLDQFLQKNITFTTLEIIIKFQNMSQLLKG